MIFGLGLLKSDSGRNHVGDVAAMSNKKIWVVAFVLAALVEAISTELWRDPDIPRWLGATLMLGVLFGFLGLGLAALLRKMARKDPPGPT